MNDIKEELRELIAEMTFSNKEDIQYDTMIFEEGIFDSMGILSLIDFLDEKYKVDVNDTELVEENFGNIERITSFIVNKLK